MVRAGARQGRCVEFPIRPALARAVPTLPTGPTWHFEIKVDGHRMILRRTEDGVVCYSRTGRTVTSHWMDLAVPAMALQPETVLDGEAVIWNGGTIDFGAVQARAASSLGTGPAPWPPASPPPTPRSTSWPTPTTAETPLPPARTPSAVRSWSMS